MIKRNILKIINEYTDTEEPEGCLNCGSTALRMGRPCFYDVGKLRILVTCDNCDTTWYELYTFAGLGEAP